MEVKKIKIRGEFKMKLINLIIGKMFEEELKEIKELLLNDVASKEEIINSNFKYIGDAESFMYEKKKSKELDQFKILIEEDILNLELDSYDHPIHVWKHNNKIVEIIDNALEDGLYADGNCETASNFSDIIQNSMPQGVSTISSPVESEQSDLNKLCEFFISLENRVEKLESNKVDKVSGEDTIKVITEGLKKMGVTITTCKF